MPLPQQKENLPRPSSMLPSQDDSLSAKSSLERSAHEFFFPKQGSAITLHRAQYLSSANETQSKKKNPLLFPCNKLRQIPHLRNTRRVQTMLRTLHTKFLVEHILLAFFKKKK